MDHPPPRAADLLTLGTVMKFIAIGSFVLRIEQISFESVRRVLVADPAISRFALGPSRMLHLETVSFFVPGFG